MKRRMMMAGIVVMCLLVPLAGAALACNKIVAFGDSLSDNGPADGYGFGVWTNGNVWLEYLAREMNVELEDRALGGAKTSGHESGYDIYGLDWQIAQYMAETPTNADLRNTLFSIWIGGNDFLFMEAGADPSVVVGTAINNIAASIQMLVDAGAKNILILNLPNLGATPLNNGNPVTAAGAQYISEAFNSYLRQTMCGFTVQYPHVRFYMVDVYELLNFILDDPADFGFSNTTGYGDASNNWEGYVFWDGIHPTTAAHKIVAAAAAAQVDPWGLSWETRLLLYKIRSLHPLLPFKLDCYLDSIR